MNADKARLETTLGKRRRARRQITEEQKKAYQAAEHQKWLKKDLMPRRLREIKAAIRKAAGGGDNNTTCSFQASGIDFQIETRLQQEGYTTKVTFENGVANMGDSAAPCMVEYNNVLFEISW